MAKQATQLNAKTSLRRATDELSEGLFNWRLWTAFGYEQLRQTYRRTMLGLAWIAIAFCAFALIKVLIFGDLGVGSGRFFTTWMVSGFVMWQLVSGFVTSGTTVFIGAAGWIKGVSLPLSVYVYQSLWQQMLQAFITIPCAFLIIIVFGDYSALGLALSLLAIPAYLLTAVPVQILLGVICTFARDLQQFVSTMIRLLFFATPIIWVPVEGSVRETVATINPLSYVLALFRDPILYGTVSFDALAVWATITLIAWLAALVVFARWRNQIVLWL